MSELVQKSTAATQPAQTRFPGTKTLLNATKLAIMEDKPIMMDYWVQSLTTNPTTNERCIVIGVTENDVKHLIKSDEEYTSAVAKIYKCETEYIIMTENSIYIVDAEIQTKKIKSD